MIYININHIILITLGKDFGGNFVQLESLGNKCEIFRSIKDFDLFGPADLVRPFMDKFNEHLLR